MPYIPSYTFAPGTPIDADHLRKNNETLRAYLNRRIPASDVAGASVDTQEIVKGEPNFVTGDYQFTTGNQYNQFVDSEEINASYFTGQIKTIDASSYDEWWTLAETGKKISMSESGRVFVHAGIEVLGDANFAMDYDNDGTVDHDALGSELLLNIDGTLHQITSGWVFEGTSAAAGPSQTVRAATKARYYPVSYLTDVLSAGEHSIFFQVNPTIDQGSVRARNITFEILYT